MAKAYKLGILGTLGVYEKDLLALGRKKHQFLQRLLDVAYNDLTPADQTKYLTMAPFIFVFVAAFAAFFLLNYSTA